MARLDETTQRRILSGSMLGAGVVLAVVLFAIVNYFGWKYHARFDWTRTNLYSLSEKTENVLSGLDREIEIIVFLSPVEPLYGPVSELLASYEGASKRIDVRYVDPEKNLLEAQALVDRFELTQLNVLVFDAGDDRRVVDLSDLADYDYSGMQYGQGPQMTGFKGEQVFTSTLVELMESRKPKILFTSGHGEMQLDDFSPRGLSLAQDLLGKDNFELEDWISLGQTAVPEGTDLIVIAGPTSNFVEPELALLRSYLETGGRLLVLLDPTMTPASSSLVETGLESLLREFGVEVGDDIVVDPANPLPFFGAETIFVNVYGSHVITRPLDQAQLPVIVPMARSVRAADQTEGFSVTELMLTSIEGWAESDLGKLDEVAKQDSDLSGPVSLAVAVSLVGDEAGDSDEQAEPAEPQAAEVPDSMRLVVVGDSDLVSNSQLQQVPNATFFSNVLNWLVERETLLGIPPKQPEQARLSLTRSELSRLSWLVLVGLPGLAVALGVAVYLQRRR